MSIANNKRSTMIFYSDSRCHYSHRVRIIMAEKGVTVEMHNVDTNAMPEDIAQLNPYNELPVMVDRDLVLYDSNVMMEYLDERFPHPPLLPVYPVERAEIRLLAYRIERDWSACADVILDDKASAAKKEKARKTLRDSLITIAPIFAEHDYFMSEDFSIVDCIVAPLLWRLPQLGIELPVKQCKHLLLYMTRLFSRESFVLSLSEFEKEIPNAFSV